MTEELKDTAAQAADTVQTVTQETPAAPPIVASMPMATETATQAIAQNTVEQDLATVQAKKEELIAAGETLFKDEIASLDAKVDDLKTRLSKVEDVRTELTSLLDEVAID